MQRYGLIFSVVILLLSAPFMACASSSNSNSGNNSTSSALPSRAQVESSLNLLSKQHSLSSSDKLSQQNLLKVLSLLDEIDQVKQEQTALTQQVAQAPAQQRKVSSDLEALKENSPPEPDSSQLANLTIHQLEQQLNNAMDAFQTAQTNLSSYSSQLISLQTQPERIQDTMLNATQMAQEIRNQLNSTLPPVSDAERQLLTTRLTLFEMKLDYQRQQLAANTTLQDLLQKQRDYTTAYISQQEKLIQVLQEVINNKRLNLSEKSIRETQQDIDQSQHNPLFEQVIATNKALSQNLLQATENSNALEQQNTRVKNWLDQIQQATRNLKEQIAVLKGSILLSRILYQQQEVLPDSLSIEDLTNRIGDLRLQQFEINQQRDTLFRGQTYLQQLGLKGEEPGAQEIEDQLGTLVEVRRDLLDRLNRQLGEELRLSINLQINQQQLLHLNATLQDTLKQQI
ncbi:MAG: mechanosensitive channel MscK, partial [Enterobacteriaceae bacterium]